MKYAYPIHLSVCTVCRTACRRNDGSANGAAMASCFRAGYELQLRENVALRELGHDAVEIYRRGVDDARRASVAIIRHHRDHDVNDAWQSDTSSALSFVADKIMFMDIEDTLQQSRENDL